MTRVVLRAKNDWVQRHASEQRAQKTMHHPSSRNCRATYSMPVSSRKMGRGQKAGGTGKRGPLGRMTLSGGGRYPPGWPGEKLTMMRACMWELWDGGGADVVGYRLDHWAHSPDFPRGTGCGWACGPDSPWDWVCLGMWC